MEKKKKQTGATEFLKPKKAETTIFDIDYFGRIVEALLNEQYGSKKESINALDSVFKLGNDKIKYLEAIDNAMKLLKEAKNEYIIVREHEFIWNFDGVGETRYIKTLWAEQASYLYDLLSEFKNNPDSNAALSANTLWYVIKCGKIKLSELVDKIKPNKKVQKQKNRFDSVKFEEALSITISKDYSLFGKLDDVFAQGIDQVTFCERIKDAKSHISKNIQGIESGYPFLTVDAAANDFYGKAYWTVLGGLLQIGSKPDSEIATKARQIWNAKRSLFAKGPNR